MFEALFPMEKEIVDKLERKARELYQGPGSTNTRWTESFKDVLFDMGEGQGYKAYCSRREPERRHGWLWDVCWLIVGTKWTELRGVMLACEIEWNPDEYYLLEDFLKLTVCEANYRLFIFTMKKPDDFTQFDLLMNACPGSRGYRYLAIGVPRTKDWRDQKLEKLPYRAWTL